MCAAYGRDQYVCREGVQGRCMVEVIVKGSLGGERYAKARGAYKTKHRTVKGTATLLIRCAVPRRGNTQGQTITMGRGGLES